VGFAAGFATGFATTFVAAFEALEIGLTAAFDTGFIESLTDFDACFTPVFKLGFAAGFAGDFVTTFELPLLTTPEDLPAGFAALIFLVAALTTTFTDFFGVTLTTVLGLDLLDAIANVRFLASTVLLPEAWVIFALFIGSMREVD